MFDNYIHITVFISCPSDVESEKQIVKDICDEINQILGHRYKIWLTVKEWRTLVPPHYGKRIQEIISLQIGEYDVFFGILWKRFGTPTGEINKTTGIEYQSGTEEEFEEALTKWQDKGMPLINFYFKKEKYTLPELADLEQFKKVLEFEKRLMSNEGWLNSFATSQEFEKSARKLLMALVLDYHDGNFVLPLNSSNDSIPPFPNYWNRRISRLIQRDDKLHIDGHSEMLQFDLSDQILVENRIVLIGDPGVGKSKELKRIEYIFSNNGAKIKPFLILLNTYVDEELDKLLPSEWIRLPENKCLILLDGLDEVQQDKMNIAKRRIQSFADRHPSCKIIISCRPNFYSYGEFEGFKNYLLNPLEVTSIRKILQADLGGSLEEFDATYGDTIPDILGTPFYLNEMIKMFKQEKGESHG